EIDPFTGQLPVPAAPARQPIPLAFRERTPIFRPRSVLRPSAHRHTEEPTAPAAAGGGLFGTPSRNQGIRFEDSPRVPRYQPGTGGRFNPIPAPSTPPVNSELDMQRLMTKAWANMSEGPRAEKKDIRSPPVFDGNDKETFTPWWQMTQQYLHVTCVANTGHVILNKVAI